MGAVEKLQKQPDSAERRREVLWFIARGPMMKGPFSQNTIQEMLRKKEVSIWDYCWSQGFKEWRPLFLVEDFDRRNRLQRLSPYPTVEPPASKVAFERRFRSQNKSAVAVVRKTSRTSISLYEWGIAALLSLALGFFFSSIALEEVENQFAAKMALSRLGEYQQLGINPIADGQNLSVSIGFMDPILSAPGAVETPKDFLPVYTEDSLSMGEKGWNFEHLKLQSPWEQDFDSPQSHLPKDDVYRVRLKAYGHLVVQPKQLAIEPYYPGAPAATSESSRLPYLQ